MAQAEQVNKTRCCLQPSSIRGPRVYATARRMLYLPAEAPKPRLELGAHAPQLLLTTRLSR